MLNAGRCNSNKLPLLDRRAVLCVIVVNCHPNDITVVCVCVCVQCMIHTMLLRVSAHLCAFVFCAYICG